MELLWHFMYQHVAFLTLPVGGARYPFKRLTQSLLHTGALLYINSIM